MPRCRESVIELIDLALGCERLLNFCGCQVLHSGLLVCDGCRIKKALKVARICIVEGVSEVNLLNVRLIGVQDAIEDKLQAFLGDGELEEGGGTPDE